MGGDISVGKRSVLMLTLRLNLMYYLLESCAGQTSSQCGRKDSVQMTVMSFKPQNSESTDEPLPHYECYLGAEDADAVVSSSRPFNTRNNEDPQPSSPARLMDTNLPPNTAAHTVTLDTDNDNAFGVFTCDASKEGRQSTTISTIFLRSDGYIFPSNELFTNTVNAGDTDVIIDMTVPDPAGLLISRGEVDIRWRINGSQSIRDPGGAVDYINEDYELLRSQPVSVNDEGVYEAQGFLLRNARHALQRLIVRSCTAGKWGRPGCNGICDNCYNGGVCDDETGRCICPPGFMGTNCLAACGVNKFGYFCEFQCDYGGSSDCIGRLFCVLDPYGCTCNTGYKDLNCMTECEPTKYGASCLQQCHCDDGNGGCNRFTGVCDSGTCQSGWHGTNCQVPDVCPAGFFGSECTSKCPCLDGRPCNRNTGACSDGQCAPGTARQAGSNECQECPDGFYVNCSMECHCEADACDKITGECTGCCKPQWLETSLNTCQAGLERSSFSKVNPGQSTIISCVATVGTGYSIYLSRQANTWDNSGITRGDTVNNGMNSHGFSISTTDFTVKNASSADVFFCLLLDTTLQPVAWLNTIFTAYELPVLNDPPTSPNQTNDSVTIRWRAWDAAMDVGDPPVVSYIAYYKEMGADMWTEGSDVSFDAPLEFTASGLNMDVNYTFSVAAVREGEGGEGPRSLPLTVKTFCLAPAAPINVQASLTDDNKVKVSWQIPPGIVCSTGIISFTIYVQIEGSSEEPVMVTVGGDTTSYIIGENLEAGKNYVFQVSLTTDQESAHSLRSRGVMYRGPSDPQPSGPNPVIFIFIAIVIVLIVIISILVVVKRNFLGTRSQDKSETVRDDSVVYANAGAVDEPGDYSTIELDSKEGSKPSCYPHRLHQGQSGEIMSEYEETGLDKEKGKVRGSEYESVASNKPGRYNLPTQPTPHSNSKVQSEEHNYEEPGDFENYTGVYINIPKKNKPSPPKPIKVSEFQSFMKKDKTVLVEGIVKEFMVLLKGKQYSCSVAEQHHLQKNKSQEILP